MSTEFKHGVSVIEVDSGSRPIRVVSTSVIGLVATADDADDATFPLNRPVLLANLLHGIDKAGSQGTLAPTLHAIYKQANAMTVVVRVASDSDADEQDALVVGTVSAGRKTGLKALLAAKAELGVSPKILAAPGLDTKAVTTELVSIAQKLNGFVYAGAPGESKEEAVRYAGNFGQRELMLLYPKFTGFNEVARRDSDIEATAVALGLRARLDNEVGWHKSISNVVVNGVSGLSIDVDFDFTSAATDAHYLNSNNITTLVREQGFRLWGNRTLSSDPKYCFETYVRTAQVLKETMARAHLWAIDKPLTPGLASDIIAGLNGELRALAKDGYLIGAEAWYDPDRNSKDSLREGKLTVNYDITPVPPLEHLSLRQHLTDTYLIDFARRIETGG